MPVPRYSPEEFARRGREWYEKEIRQNVESGNEGKAVIIDIETGDYEMDQDSLAATHRFLAKKPDAQLYAIRVGYPAFAKRGGGWSLSRR